MITFRLFGLECLSDPACLDELAALVDEEETGSAFGAELGDDGGPQLSLCLGLLRE